MSEAPTHAAGVPTPARQQAERTPQTERTPQQAQRTDIPRTDAQRTDVQRTDAQRVDGQRTDASRTDASRTDAQRTDVQRTDAHRVEAQRTETQRTETQRPDADHSEHQRAEHRLTEPKRTGHESAGKLEDEWQAVQYEFVDDPKSAVRKADDLVTRALEELNTRHRSLTKQLEGNSDPQTEDLRLALHRYRELFKSLVAVK